GGEGLAGYLAHLDRLQLDAISQDLRRFFPEVQRISNRPLPDGNSELMFQEPATSQERSAFLSSALHISDGRLRVLALIAQCYSAKSLILLDEIENGIYPGLAEKLIDYVRERARESGKQFWITTHNPLILNYLPDDVATESIYLVRRGKLAETSAEPYFSSDLTRDKLRYMGPGEVFLDTQLELS
ncbi:unnamed protein product, partial [Phaeothamnion confervicola]